MDPSNPKSPANDQIGMFWGIVVFLAFEFGIFVIVRLFTHAAGAALLGSYIAVAVPGVTFLLAVSWLWKWESRRPAPRQFAIGWGFAMAVFFLAVCIAFFYSSVTLGLVNSKAAVWVFGMMAAAGTPLSFYILYDMTLKRILAKTTGESDGALAK